MTLGELKVLLHTDSMNSSHVHLFPGLLCFGYYIIIFSHHTEIIDSLSMLAWPFFTHGLKSIIILHHFLSTDRSSYCSIKHLVDIDAIGFAIQLFMVSLMLVDTWHTWEWMITHHTFINLQSVVFKKMTWKLHMMKYWYFKESMAYTVRAQRRWGSRWCRTWWCRRKWWGYHRRWWRR